MNAIEHKNELDKIKMWLYSGAVSYDYARELAEPHLKALNDKAKEIAKKFGMKPKLISFSAFMR